MEVGIELGDMQGSGDPEKLQRIGAGLFPGLGRLRQTREYPRVDIG